MFLSEKMFGEICMNTEDLLLCKAKTKSGAWVYGLPMHQDTGYTYAFVPAESKGLKYTHPDDIDVKHFTELAIQTRTENGILVTHSIVPETLCRFTGMLDINKNKIFENDILLTQPYTDKPLSAKAKSKRHKGIVEYHRSTETNEVGWALKFITDTGKFNCCNWNDFYESQIIGNRFDENQAEA